VLVKVATAPVHFARGIIRFGCRLSCSKQKIHPSEFDCSHCLQLFPTRPGKGVVIVSATDETETKCGGQLQPWGWSCCHVNGVPIKYHFSLKTITLDQAALRKHFHIPTRGHRRARDGQDTAQVQPRAIVAALNG
jgi:hypothetical protein